MRLTRLVSVSLLLLGSLLLATTLLAAGEVVRRSVLGIAASRKQERTSTMIDRKAFRRLLPGLALSSLLLGVVLFVTPATIQADAPAPPSSLSATPVSQAQISLSWTDNSSDEDGFKIEQSPDGTSGWTQVDTVGANASTYYDYGLTCNTTYYYRVRAYNADGDSGYSNSASATTPACTDCEDTYEPDNEYPAATYVIVNEVIHPHNFHAAGDEDWLQFAATAGTAYTMTTSNLGSSNNTILALYDTDGTTLLASNDDCDFTLASCINNWTAPGSATYFLRVLNYREAGGCTEYGYDLAIMDARGGIEPLAAPSNLQATAVSRTQINLAWVDNSGNEGSFRIERSLNGVSAWSEIGTTSINSASYSNTGLTCGTTYYYRVRAHNGDPDCYHVWDFNGSAPDWTIHSGAWYVDSDFLWTSGISDAVSSVSYDAAFADLDYQASLWRYGCDTCANRLYVRGTPEPLDSSTRWYAGYMFQYHRNGRHSVWKYDAGSPTALQYWAYSPAINQGDAWNTLRVVAHDGSLYFYINGTLVWSGSDSSLTSGRVGIGMYRSSDSTDDDFFVDESTLSTCPFTGLGTFSVSDTVSAEQQSLNDAANEREWTSEDVNMAPSAESRGVGAHQDLRGPAKQSIWESQGIDALGYSDYSNTANATTLPCPAPAPTVYAVYLPTLLKAPPLTYLYLSNNTAGSLTYTVFGTPQGDITCHIAAGAQSAFCGTFTPRTYRWRVVTVCSPPTKEGTRTYDPGRDEPSPFYCK